MSQRGHIAWGLGFGLAGLVLNLAAIEVLPGVHLLLGPLMTLACAVLRGPVGGGLAGAVSGLATLWLWGHPWGLLNMTAEGLFVGALRRRFTPITADGLYWLVSPFYFLLTYWLLAGIPAGATLVAGVKQAVNGLLAALLVQVLLLIPFVRRHVRGLLPPPLADMSISRAFSSALTLGAIIPVLVVGGSESRARYLGAVHRTQEDNLHAAQVVATEIERSLEHARHSTSLLARTLGASLSPEGMLPGQAFLESELDALVIYSPEVVNAYVGSPEGIALAFSPRNGPTGEPLVGTDFSDRDYVRAVQQAQGPLVSDVFLGRGGVQGPLVVALAPIRRAGHYAGYVLTAMNLPRLRTLARAQVRSEAQRIQVIDSRGGVVFDSAQEGSQQVRSIAETPLGRALGQVGGSSTGQYLNAPDSPTLVRAGSVYHFGVQEVASLGWKVVVEQSAARLQHEVHTSYVGLLAAMGVATVAAVLLALALSRAIVSPVKGVSHAAERLAAGERSARAREVAEDAPLEPRQLAHTFDRMARQIAQQLEAIERASRQKDAFLTIASHELKTPLTVLKAQLQLLRRRPGEATPERLEHAGRQVDRLTRLVNQLLDASELGLGQLPLQRAPVDLSEVCQRVAEELVSTSPRHTLLLELEPARGEFDAPRLEQVVHNLVSNAIKYSPTGGPIELRVRTLTEDAVELRVADRGIGLRGEDEAQLFERFERGDRRELAGISGIGVGLYVSREIVRRHEGHITLRPREGGGAVATVTLPTRPAPRSASQTPRDGYEESPSPSPS
jgi:signal transduction histidine kinase